MKNIKLMILSFLSLSYHAMYAMDNQKYDVILYNKVHGHVMQTLYSINKNENDASEKVASVMGKLSTIKFPLILAPLLEQSKIIERSELVMLAQQEPVGLTCFTTLSIVGKKSTTLSDLERIGQAVDQLLQEEGGLSINKFQFTRIRKD